MQSKLPFNCKFLSKNSLLKFNVNIIIHSLLLNIFKRKCGIPFEFFQDNFNSKRITMFGSRIYIYISHLFGFIIYNQFYDTLYLL